MPADAMNVTAVRSTTIRGTPSASADVSASRNAPSVPASISPATETTV